MILEIASVLALLASAAGSKEPPPDMVPASAAEIEAVCKTVLCRPPKPIRLKLEDGRVFEMTAAPDLHAHRWWKRLHGSTWRAGVRRGGGQGRAPHQPCRRARGSSPREDPCLQLQAGPDPW